MPVSRHDKRLKARKAKQRRNRHKAALAYLEERLAIVIKNRIEYGSTPSLVEWIKSYQRRIKAQKRLLR